MSPALSDGMLSLFERTSLYSLLLKTTTKKFVGLSCTLVYQFNKLAFTATGECHLS